MTSPLDLPILISQLPHVAKLQNAEQVKPELQRSLFAPLIAEHLRRNQQRVNRVDKNEEVSALNQDGEGQQGGQPPAGNKEKKKDPDAETNASESSPWSGNIVDMKI